MGAKTIPNETTKSKSESTIRVIAKTSKARAITETPPTFGVERGEQVTNELNAKAAGVFAKEAASRNAKIKFEDLKKDFVIEEIFENGRLRRVEATILEINPENRTLLCRMDSVPYLDSPWKQGDIRLVDFAIVTKYRIPNDFK